ncbi:hypothetical protein AGMMS49992_21870 [Clostridia bacterium]|nr:hypothetical protein AGMMS49992_21870 [Clostridia bacterium]
MRWSSNEFLAHMFREDSGQPHREMLAELFGPLIGLEDEWKAQGATPAQLDLTAFCFDYVEPRYIQGLGILNPNPDVLLEETDTYIIFRDALGRKIKRIKGVSTIGLPMDYPVRNGDDWLKIRSLYAWSPERLANARADAESLRAAQNAGAYIVAYIPGGFDTLRELMGEENACLAYYDQPELVEDIFATISETNTRVTDFYSAILIIDQISVHEDLAGKGGPLIGPNIVREFIKPYYRAAWDLASARGTRVFSQDSDGNITPVIESFMECGVNLFYPCEPAAGMDIVALRKKFGSTLLLKGGINKHVLRESKAAIRAELEYKLQPCMLGGGTIFGLDHRIPNGTPLENYIYYVKTARELLNLPLLEEAEPGWGRMGF